MSQNAVWESYAPGRAEFLGNHTDYNDGLVLGLGLGVGVTVKGSLRGDGRMGVTAADLGRRCEEALDRLSPREEEPWANYVFGVAAGFLARGANGSGLDLEICSNVPMGAGLSSSAALECATARLLQKAWGTEFDELELARIGQEAEHRFAGVRCGLLDQVTSLFARKDHAVYLDCRSLQVRRVPVPPRAMFVIAQSGVKHALSDGAYNARREECEVAAQVLRVGKLREVSMDDVEAAARDGRLADAPLQRARHVVSENVRVVAAVQALERGDLAAVGALMNESHESSRLLFENSCEEVDFLAATARQCPGCYGARLSGGGFGGAILAMVEAERTDLFVEVFAREVRAAWGREPELLVTGADGPVD